MKNYTPGPLDGLKVTMVDHGAGGYFVNLTKDGSLLEHHSFPPGCTGGVQAADCHKKMLEGVEMARSVLSKATGRE